jgi:hypothetical protein
VLYLEQPTSATVPVNSKPITAIRTIRSFFISFLLQIRLLKV